MLKIYIGKDSGAEVNLMGHYNLKISYKQTLSLNFSNHIDPGVEVIYVSQVNLEIGYEHHSCHIYIYFYHITHLFPDPGVEVIYMGHVSFEIGYKEYTVLKIFLIRLLTCSQILEERWFTWVVSTLKLVTSNTLALDFCNRITQVFPEPGVEVIYMGHINLKIGYKQHTVLKMF